MHLSNQREVDNNNNPAFTKQVVELLTVANEFCLFTQKVSDYSKEDIVVYYRRIIPLLYLKGSLVKDILPQNAYLNERFVLEEEWETVFNNIRNKLYPDDHFWVCADPHSEDTEAEKASIAECIADCYQDMRDFVMLFQKNLQDARENAVHEVVINFNNHWGPAFTKALYALHFLSAGAQ